MIKFLTRAELNTYLATTPREGMYSVAADETMQKKKATFSYFNGELLLESGGWKEPNWLADVATYTAITTTHLTPIGLDAVKVLADEGHSGQPTWYLHNGTSWIYQGIYFVEAIVFNVSEANTRASDIASSTDYTITIPYLVGKGHLYIFIDGEETVKGIDWNEVGTTGFVSTKIQFLNTIPKESRLVFKRTIANTNDDKIASRLNKDVWLKFMNDSYIDLDDKILKSSLKIVSSIIGKTITGFIQDQTSITKDNIYLDKTDNKMYIARLDKTSTWSTVNTTDFAIHDIATANKKSYKAKVSFEVVRATGVVTIVDSDNIQSVTRLADGKYRVTYALPLDKAVNTYTLTHRIDWDVNENAYSVRIARNYVANKNYVDIVCGYYSFGTAPVNMYADTNMVSLVVF